MTQDPAAKPPLLAVDVLDASLIYNPQTAPVHALSHVDLAIEPGAVSYTHLTLPTIYSV